VAPVNILEARDLLLNHGKTIYDLPLRVTYYSRVSTDSMGQQTSIDNQNYYYSQLIKNNSNWTYVEGYCDEGITGTSTNKREEFNRMIEDGLNGKFDLIITKEVSRFARNTLDSIYYTRELLKNNVAVYFESDNINTLYPDSEFKLTIIASLAQEESRKTSQRVKWAKRRLAEKGVIYIPYNMYGYRKVNGKVEIVEKEAEAIRRLFTLFRQGYGLRKTGQILKEEGYATRSGKPFSPSTIRKIITNPRLKGYFTACIVETVDFISKKKVMKDPKEWIIFKAPDIIPPIVSEEEWDEANRLLETKRKMVYLKHETSYQNKYKYSGKIFCKKHGTAYHRTVYRYKSGDKELYQCKIYRTQGKDSCNSPLLYTNEIDAIMSCIFKVMFKQKDDLIDKLLKMIEKNLEENDFTKDINKILDQINQIKKKKDKLLDLVMNDYITKQEFRERNETLNRELNVLKEELKKYEELRDAKRNVRDQLKLMEEFLKKEYNLDREVPEELIDAFLDKIYVEAGEIDNLVKLEINLKTGQKLPTYYRKDILLCLTTHIAENKMMFKFPRIKNNQKAEPVRIKVKSINLKIAI